MKKVLIGIVVLTLIAVGAIAYAQGPGWYRGDQVVPCYGYDYHMRGPGYGGSMMGWRGGGNDQKFLDETVGVRKQLNSKRFEYSEAIRNPKTDPETVAKLERENGELQNQVYAKAPQGTNRGYRMPCWQQ